MATYASSAATQTSDKLLMCSQSADTSEPVFFDLVNLQSEELIASFQSPEWSLCQSITFYDEFTALILTLKPDRTFRLITAYPEDGSFYFEESIKPFKAFFDS